ncbi:type II secretion system F family protein [Candidatus Pelagibacter ubique]|nr:type II secretion system F family protein [Candidatus Pelagibacter ubique]MDA7812360.1 type II secretion system F family protein [Candidatus Pelagibacter sp.]MDA9188892.1 type II secretion system F family protein [Candidatus Pelagibacter sp.]MDB3903371.1 type II secretion system F family protein [Candidatus Pelagibacter sp.]MDB9732095.1 type II secretion system F family protein [Candidatus Pelagibacter sp.]
MEAFTYKGISEGKYIEGDIEAINLDEASHLLKEKKIIITNINKSKKKKEGAKKKSSGSSIFGKKKVKVQEILIFSKQFATMVKAGLPILQVLIMLRDQLESPAIKEVIEDIRKSLEGGVNLSRCFEKYPQYFDNVYVNLIKAGEASGKLDVFLLKIVESLEKKEKIKKKIKGALMYPAIMFTVAVTVSAFMLIKVVPVFAKMYDGMGIELPAATATIMAMSDFLSGTGGKILFFGGIGAYFGFNFIIKRNAAIRFKWHQQILKLPIFGDMILKSLLARISLIMGNLSAAGVNLLESIEIAKSVSNNDVVTEALENVKKGVFSGDTLTKLFLKEPLFPPTFSQLISVGEQTGQLDEMFNSVSAYYEEEFDTTVDNMSALIEPIMIVFMGVMIGGLMIAMYSPIFNVGALIN